MDFISAEINSSFTFKFRDSINSITHKFKNKSIEIKYRNSKYGKRKLLTAICFLIVFNTMITTIRQAQRLVTTIFSSITIQGDFPVSEFASYVSMLSGSLAIETIIYFCPKLSLFRGIIGALAPFMATIYRSYKVSMSLPTDYPLFLPFCNFTLINLLIIAILYSWNWICGMFIILAATIIYCIYTCMAPWSWYTDKPIIMLNYITCAFIIIVVLYYFDYTHRKCFFRRFISDLQKNNFQQVVNKHPDPIIIACDGYIVNKNEAFTKLIPGNGTILEENNLNNIAQHLNSSRQINDNTQILASIINTETNISLSRIIKEENSQMTNKQFTMNCPTESKTLDFELLTVNLDLNLISQKSILYFLRNVTNIVSMEKEKAQHESKLKYLSLYMSSVTHDFRTPLGIIDGNLEEIIVSYGHDSRMMKNIANIKKSTAILTLLVQDILDASSIKENHFRLKIASFNLQRLIEEMKDLFLMKYQDKGLYLEMEYLTEIPTGIQSDEGRIKQIFFNLLSNAYKFTVKGGVTIIASYDQILKEVSIQIQDTGVGISSDKINTLFNPFQKLEEHSLLNPNGIGLGLHNCKNLAEKLQGSINVTSVPGSGSIFTFCFKNIINRRNSRFGNALIKHTINNEGRLLSLTIAKTAEHLKKKSNDIRKDEIHFNFNLSHTVGDIELNKICKCPKILIVDDDESCRSVYKFYLGQYHIPYIEAKNGKEAISSVELFSSRECCNYFRIILIDNIMPEMTGVDASFHIHEYLREHALEGTKIILATGDNLQLSNEEENIFWKILTKPISSNDFKEEVIKSLV